MVLEASSTLQPTDTRKRSHFWLVDDSRAFFGLPACLALQVIVFAAIAHWRLIDSDEGLYLLAAKLAAHGKRPYLDFFYQQMPAFPYVYGAWSKFAGLSWVSARMLSVLCTAALGGLLYRHVAQLYSQKMLAWLGVSLYALNNLIIGWHTVVKTYALSNLLLFCAYLLAFPGKKRHPGLSAFLSGVFLALAVDTRLYLIAVTPVLMVSVFWAAIHCEENGFKRVALLFGGLIFGLLPNLWFLLHGSDPFVFDNLGYHLIRSDSALRAGVRQKFETLFAITNIQGSDDGSGAQFFWLGLAAIAVTLVRGFDRRLLIPLAIGLLMFLVCLVPSPTFLQYFCVCVPYLITVALGFVGIMARSNDRAQASSQLVRTTGISIAVLYVFCGLLAIWNYTFWGTGVEGIWRRENAFDYEVSTVRQVSQELNHLVAPNEPVISFWPGYLVECQCVPEAGTENDFALWISTKLTPEQAAQRRIVTDAGVEELLGRHGPRAVIVRSQDVWGGWGISFRDTLARSGYKLVRSIGRAEIYVYPDWY